MLALRTGLGLIGGLQLVLGLAQVGRGRAAGHAHGPLGMLASGHLWHESAAWNIAVGAGFLFVATRRTPDHRAGADVERVRRARWCCSRSTTW